MALDSPTFTLDAGSWWLGAAGTITIPIPASLIEHERGLVLFDTGRGPRAADDPEAVSGAVAPFGI